MKTKMFKSFFAFALIIVGTSCMAQKMEVAVIEGTVISVSEEEIITEVTVLSEKFLGAGKGVVVDRYTGSEFIQVVNRTSNGGVYLPMPDKPLGVSMRINAQNIDSSSPLEIGDIFVATVWKEFSPAEEQLKAAPRH